VLVAHDTVQRRISSRCITQIMLFGDNRETPLRLKARRR
jgi:hypothetical protein